MLLAITTFFCVGVWCAAKVELHVVLEVLGLRNFCSHAQHNVFCGLGLGFLGFGAQSVSDQLAKRTTPSHQLPPTLGLGFRVEGLGLGFRGFSPKP